MNTFFKWGLASAALSFSLNSHALDLTPEVMLNLTVIAASDYRVGGFSLTQGNPVLQTVGNLVHKPTGLFAGVFTSNVDFGTDTRREYDYFVGIARPLSENTRFSLAYVAYDYPKDSWVNFNEWVGTFSYKGATAGFKYTNNLQNPPALDALAEALAPLGIKVKDRDNDRIITWVEYTQPMPYQTLLNVRYGYSDTHDEMAYRSGSGDYRGTYYDWSVAVSKQLFGLDWKATYIDTDLSKAECMSAFGRAGDCSATVVASVSKSF
jgi:uncharacterized protein (TIGR02001 family)